MNLKSTLCLLVVMLCLVSSPHAQLDTVAYTPNKFKWIALTVLITTCTLLVPFTHKNRWSKNKVLGNAILFFGGLT